MSTMQNPCSLARIPGASQKTFLWSASRLGTFRSAKMLVFASFVVTSLLVPSAHSKDYFLTIAGGYNPRGNQASLEANVLFFREVVDEQHRGSRNMATFFADGYDEAPDLQVAVQSEESKTPATDLLQSIYRSRGSGRSEVIYRNHRVPDIAGPLSPDNIKNNILRQASRMQAGDRFFIYVTAHGGSAKGSNTHNTSISCWDDQSIRASEFESWLDAVPGEVPVIMVMAQCYCGGFSHLIFDKADARRGLSSGNRVGFFAQQHNLPAAGCRPDIENDEEYSSFFWGAFVGRSRNGKPADGMDLNNDGRISFAEAHVHAVSASETIDIPLRTSDSFLRVYSRLQGQESDEREKDANDEFAAADGALTAADGELPVGEDGEGSGDTPEPRLHGLGGKIRHVIEGAQPEQSRLVELLAGQLEISLDDDVTAIHEAMQSARGPSMRGFRSRGAGRGSRRGRGGMSSIREAILEELEENFPELAERETWEKSDLLQQEQQAKLLEELLQLPTVKQYADMRKRFAEFSSQRQEAEAKRVKYQRLLFTLESIVLAKNLPLLVEPEIVTKYEQILELESGFLPSTL